MDQNWMKRQRELTDRLNRYRNEYYNLNSPSVSDTAYDRLFEELQAVEKQTGVQMANSPTNTVGYPAVSKLEKTNHSIPLLSLDKVKNTEELCRFKETLTDTIFAVSQTLEQEVMERLPLWEKIESGALLYALKQLDERERYVFLARVLDKRPFDVIGVKLGLSYKGAAAVYYRAILKLKKSIEGVNGYDI